MVDEDKPYAALFPDHVRQRAADALERDAGTAPRRELRAEPQQAKQDKARAAAQRVVQLRHPTALDYD
jgi:hypothetical protein